MRSSFKLFFGKSGLPDERSLAGTPPQTALRSWGQDSVHIFPYLATVAIAIIAILGNAKISSQAKCSLKAFPSGNCCGKTTLLKTFHKNQQLVDSDNSDFLFHPK